MSVKALRSFLIASGIITGVLACGALAQGFAGLGTEAEGFTIPKPGVSLAFPRDHGAHPDYRIEWWYLTANLKGSDGKDYGIQWTLFRSALAPIRKNDWSSPQIWMGHAAVTTSEHHYVAERLSRDGVGQAGVTVTPFAAWIDDWEMKSRGGTPGEHGPHADELSSLSLRASGRDFSYQLSLSASGPLVLQGQSGYSVKSPTGQASYYYSQPFYTVAGEITLPAGKISVTGKAWLDREWSSQPLASDQTGWDWFSLHMDGGEKLMGFRLRDGREGFTSATWIAADGTPTAMSPGDLRMSPLATAEINGKSIPVEWHLELPKRGLNVRTKPLNPSSWMSTRFPYWEGPIRFEGTRQGVGYLEMTGY